MQIFHIFLNKKKYRVSHVASELAKDETRELPDEELRSREGVHQPVEDKI